VGDEYVPYSTTAAAAVVDASPLEEGRGESDLAIALDRGTDASGVYPIVLVSYLIGCAEYKDAAQGELAKAYFSYVISSEGQAVAAESAGSAPISGQLYQKASGAVKAMR
jgi:phosphate transport system substrate-binding protein